jgi:hypothetical protein
MSVFEAVMLICFGLSWPVSIAKTLRTRVVAGKSPLFMAIVCVGYICGIVHKALYAFDWIIVLYAVNMVMVAVDLSLYFVYASTSRDVRETRETPQRIPTCPRTQHEPRHVDSDLAVLPRSHRPGRQDLQSVLEGPANLE